MATISKTTTALKSGLKKVSKKASKFSSNKTASTSKTAYVDGASLGFFVAAAFWSVFAFSVGDWVAWQMVFPALNFDSEYFSFGRMRPLHTSSAIFAFANSILIGSAMYIVQRTCNVALFGGKRLANFIFYGYQLFILLAAGSYLLGYTQGKEYAEPEWWIDIYLTVIWVAFLIQYVGTIATRKIKHIYVANWFYLAFIIVIAMLHIGNNLAIPVPGEWTKSYGLFSGVQDAMLQWWYGHNAVGFLLTSGFLGLMYYIVPKQANRPIFSYRLSVIHFWGLTFLYIWVGPHHLHYTSLPEWTQTLGMVMSIVLWIPSWGGMVNGMMTLSGAWDKLRTDPIIRFMVTAIAFYGMSTFEGPLMSIRTVNALSHYTDWTVGHVHSGTLGWNSFLGFGALYFFIPRMLGKKMFSLKLVEYHYWFGSAGILLYITALWIAGIVQGLMWRTYDSLGFLKYSFVETLVAIKPLYFVRATGGLFFLTGAIIMCYNLYMTYKQNEVK